MNKEQKIEIKSNNGITELFIDGHLISNVRRIGFKHDINNFIPTLTLDLNVYNLSLDCPKVKMLQQGMGEIKEIIFEKEKVEG